MDAISEHPPAEFACSGRLVEWRGPAPFWFLELPSEVSAEVKQAARGLEYWGQVKVEAVVAVATEGGGPAEIDPFRTALFPKDGRYLLPLRDAVRRAVGLTPEDAGAVLAVRFDLVRR